MRDTYTGILFIIEKVRARMSGMWNDENLVMGNIVYYNRIHITFYTVL